MHWIDQSVIIFFLLSFSIYGIWQAKNNQTSKDYFLAGKNLPWPVAMFSIVATETSVLTFISVPGLAYRGDWFFLQLAFGYMIGRVLVSIFLLHQYFKAGVVSIYEIIGFRFGELFQKIASLIFYLDRIQFNFQFSKMPLFTSIALKYAMELGLFITVHKMN